MSRIPLTSIDEQPEPVRQWMARRGNLKVFRLLANAPQVFRGWTQMVDELFESPTFSQRMREVVILRVAHLQGSRYELSQHVAIARNAGLTDQQINALTRPASATPNARHSTSPPSCAAPTNCGMTPSPRLRPSSATRHSPNC
jgi:AhpD family alkylhydroperoxidase